MLYKWSNGQRNGVTWFLGHFYSRDIEKLIGLLRGWAQYSLPLGFVSSGFSTFILIDKEALSRFKGSHCLRLTFTEKDTRLKKEAKVNSWSAKSQRVTTLNPHTCNISLIRVSLSKWRIWIAERNQVVWMCSNVYWTLNCRMSDAHRCNYIPYLLFIACCSINRGA